MSTLHLYPWQPVLINQYWILDLSSWFWILLTHSYSKLHKHLWISWSSNFEGIFKDSCILAFIGLLFLRGGVYAQIEFNVQSTLLHALVNIKRVVECHTEGAMRRLRVNLNTARQGLPWCLPRWPQSENLPCLHAFGRPKSGLCGRLSKSVFMNIEKTIYRWFLVWLEFLSLYDNRNYWQMITRIRSLILWNTGTFRNPSMYCFMEVAVNLL